MIIILCFRRYRRFLGKTVSGSCIRDKLRMVQLFDGCGLVEIKKYRSLAVIGLCSD